MPDKADLLPLIQQGRAVLRQMRDGKAWDAIEQALGAYVLALSEHRHVLEQIETAKADFEQQRGAIERTTASLLASRDRAQAELEAQRQDAAQRVAEDLAAGEKAKAVLEEQIAALVARRNAVQAEVSGAVEAHGQAVERLSRERRAAEQARDAAVAQLRLVRDGIPLA